MACQTAQGAWHHTMIEETAKVITIKDRFAWVETERKTTCGTCAVNKGCGTSVLSQVLGNKRASIRILNDIGAKPGDAVVIGIQEGTLVKGSMMIYMLPLIIMLGGALVGSLVTSLFGIDYTEGWQILFSLGGLVIGFYWVNVFSERIAQNADYQAVALRMAQSVIQFHPANKHAKEST